MNQIKKYRSAFILPLVLFVICGLVYPFTLTLIGKVFMPAQAGGSLVYNNGKAVGSSLIGQDFTDPRFMKCRPSGVGYNTYTQQELVDGSYTGVATGSANLSATNPELTQRVSQDLEQFLQQNPGVEIQEIPGDLLTASGSGLDPHISIESALIQVPALAKATGLPEATIEDFVNQHRTGKVLGLFGEETVNVLLVNLDIANATGMIEPA